ncbi:helix-turn-helix domain-containing protein [Pseudonocardiaceae bacterium YIM PH 21723]|nr:helix-turn-helix domain-containing protein [Pseudonocardiaceae bacterium YIM PH 21723]
MAPAAQGSTMRDVVIVLGDDFELLDVTGPFEVFAAASQLRPGSYRVRLASVSGADAISSSGIRMGVHTRLADLDQVDTLLISGGHSAWQMERDEELLGHIRRLTAVSRRVCSVCTGSFVLAAAGLLTGRRATTHWAYCAELEARYPQVAVDPDAIFVRDEPFITAAGVTSGMDLALALVEDDLGPDAARTVGRWLVVFLQRPGGQSQFSVRNSVPAVQTIALRRLLDSIAADPAADWSVPVMAARTSQSVRHFARTFAKEVGLSPARYVERARVEAARVRLETGDECVEAAARSCGFGTAETMRRAFLREISVPPSEYRARFRSAALAG